MSVKIDKNKLTSCSTILFSLLALLVSVGSCFYSRESNRISQEANNIAANALENSKKSFIAQNRPYIIIEIVEQKDTENYLKARVDGDHVILEIRYKVQNVGSTPAINLVAIENPKILEENSNGNLSLTSPKILPIISIPPDRKKYSDLKFIFESRLDNKQSATEFAKSINSGEQNFISQIGFTYKSNLEEQEQYKTVVAYKISKDKASLVRSIVE